MMISAALLVAYVATGAKPAHVTRPPAPAKRAGWSLVKPPSDVGQGKVSYVTADSVYLDRGKADGLTLSSKVNITRASKPVATCEIAQLSEHAAVCHAKGVRAGDRAQVDRVTAAALAGLPALPSAAELEAQRASVMGAPWALVEFDESGPAARADGSRLRVSLAHHLFADLGSAQGSFQLEQVDASLYQRLGAGFAVSADASLLVWSRKPSNNRLPRTTVLQGVVRQLEVSWQPEGAPVVVRVGRVRPRYTPGLLAIDGAQIGYSRASAEVGLYGGLLPDAVTTGVSLGQWAAGAYGMGRWVDGLGSTSSVVQGEARAGWALRPGVGSRFEAGAAMHGWVSRVLDAHVGAQFAVAPAQQAPASLELGTLDLGLTPSDRFRLHLSGRYRGNPLLEVAQVGAPLPVTRSVHASTDVSFDLLPSLTLAARAGLAWEIQGQLFQGFLGPELSWRTWQGRIGVTAGYQEELGWLRGRTWSLAAAVAPSSRFRVQARGAWFQQPTPTLGANELGVSLAIDARLTSFLLGRLYGSWRTGLAGAVSTEVLTRSSTQATAQLVIEL